MGVDAGFTIVLSCKLYCKFVLVSKPEYFNIITPISSRHAAFPAFHIKLL